MYCPPRLEKKDTITVSQLLFQVGTDLGLSLPRGQLWNDTLKSQRKSSVISMTESQVEEARRQLSDFFKSTANLQWKCYAIVGGKEDFESLSNLLDVDLGGLMKLFEMCKFVRVNSKKGWSVKTN
jgi:hypothetical protein